VLNKNYVMPSKAEQTQVDEKNELKMYNRAQLNASSKPPRRNTGDTPTRPSMKKKAQMVRSLCYPKMKGVIL
jgi:hypothetical protein